MTSQRRTIYMVKSLDWHIGQLLDATLRAVGFTTAQYTILSVIGGRPNLYSSADIARRLKIAPQSAHEVIVALESCKLIKRSPDPANAKILRISLSRQGQKTLSKLDAEVDVIEDKLLSVLSGQELLALREYISRLLTTRVALAPAAPRKAS